METIKLNDKEYVLIEEYNKVKQDYDNLCLNKKDEKATVKNIGSAYMDETNVLAIGKVDLNKGSWVRVSLSTEYLEKIIKGLKAMSCSKDGMPSVSIVFANDCICLFGRYDDKEKSVSGFMLAPRVDE